MTTPSIADRAGDDLEIKSLDAALRGAETRRADDYDYPTAELINRARTAIGRLVRERESAREDERAKIVAWLPIETAPKDGTKILLGRFVPGDEYDGRIRVDWWHGNMSQGYIGFAHFNPVYWPPTHWQPLPAPPAQSEGKS